MLLALVALVVLGLVATSAPASRPAAVRRACDDNKRTYMHMSVKLLSGTKSQRAGFEGGSRLACPYEG
jgi:hypothetical protein